MRQVSNAAQRGRYDYEGAGSRETIGDARSSATLLGMCATTDSGTTVQDDEETSQAA